MIDGIVVGRVWSFPRWTERRLAEAAQVEALNRRAENCESLARCRLSISTSTLTEHSSFPYVSEGMRELFGVDPVELQGTPTLLQSGQQNGLSHVHRRFRSQSNSMGSRVPSSTRRWISTLVYAGNSLPERDPDGSTIWHGFITDITDRKVADAKLRESERRLKEASSYFPNRELPLGCCFLSESHGPMNSIDSIRRIRHSLNRPSSPIWN